MSLPIDFTSITSESEFKAAALETFNFQYKEVAVYRRFCDLLGIKSENVTTVESIPFLPIQFFKSETVRAQNTTSEKIFQSSGTTGSSTSKHHVVNLNVYETSFLNGFQKFYSNIQDYAILALLPSYLEQGNSSLVYMANRLILESKNEHSGFYLNNLSALIEKIQLLESRGQKTLLLGVSYALLDLIDLQTSQLKHTIIMETGGMKGRRKEMIKPELHNILKKGFGVTTIHSEYGMTELLSQAYSTGNGMYKTPPWMRVFTRDTEDALSYVTETTGGINIIDLANVYSCAFIATQDLGKVHKNGTFEVMGRFDNSDIRGCNLMVL